MKPSVKNHAGRFSAAGLTTLLAAGCMMPPTQPPAITEQMSDAQKMQATFLRALHEEIRASMMQHTPEVLADKLMRYQFGINPANIQKDGETRIYIKGNYDTASLEERLYFRIDSLLKQIEAMKHANVQPPSVREVQDTIIGAVYSVLMEPKYKDMQLEEYNVQTTLGTPIVSRMVYDRVQAAVEKIMEVSFIDPLVRAGQPDVASSAGVGR